MVVRNALIVILSLTCVTLIVALLNKGSDTKPPAESLPASPVTTVTASPLPEGEPIEETREPIREEMVDTLYLGQSYENVEALWGVSSDKQESEYQRGIEGYTSPHSIVWHTWNNPDDTRVRLGFINGKLERKEFYRLDGHKISNEIDLEQLK